MPSSPSLWKRFGSSYSDLMVYTTLSVQSFELALCGFVASCIFSPTQWKNVAVDKVQHFQSEASSQRRVQFQMNQMNGNLATACLEICPNIGINAYLVILWWSVLNIQLTLSNFATTCQLTLIRVLVDFLLNICYLLWFSNWYYTDYK